MKQNVVSIEDSMEELLEVPDETDSLRENLKHMSNSHESQS